MKKLVLFVSFLFIASLCFGQNAWINELHYDNSGTDEGEFLEIVIENPGSYTLSDFTVSLYNGNDCGVYGSETLDNFIVGNTSGNYTFYTWPHAGIQNGAPDGLSLDYQGTLIQFLSYEGVFTAASGPAIGVESTDIGVSESSSTQIGESLQLSGTGTQYSEFFWLEPAPETPGALNNSQTFGSGPAPLAISNVAREYTVPTAAQSCYVSCDITGGTTPYNALIKYSVDGVAQSDVSMGNVGGDSYSGTIPVQSDGARVDYYIDVTDNAKSNVTSNTYGLFWGTSDISNSTGKIKEVNGSTGVLLYEDYYARIEGVATVATDVFTTYDTDVYLQDSYGGINLFSFDIGYAIVAGNIYSAIGKIDQYNGKAQLVPDDVTTDITDLGAGTMPSPAVITIAQMLSNPEYYEGMLIGIQHLSKTAGSDPWPSSGSNANLTMTDDGGTSETTLRIDKDTDIDENTEPIWPQDAVGIASQYDDSSPYDSGYQIIPRAYTDILPDGTLPVELSAFTAVFIENKPTLYWETQSENDNLGWNIYRNIEENFTTSQLITEELIPGHGTTSEPNYYNYSDDAYLAIEQTYYYWLESVDYSGVSQVYSRAAHITIPDPSVNPPQIEPPIVYDFKNAPNPVSTSSQFQFTLDKSSLVSVSIYNIKGELVRNLPTVLTQENEKASIYWNGKDNNGKILSPGVYFYNLIVNSNTEKTKKLILMK